MLSFLKKQSFFKGCLIKKIKRLRNLVIFLLIFFFLFFLFLKKKLNQQKLFPFSVKFFEKNKISPTIFLENKKLYPVIKIIDGDTIDVEIEGKIQRVRVIGINTPEVVDPRKQVECFGKEASKKAKELLKGKRVRLEKDETQPEVDKYQRLLRYVFLEDGTDFGLTMIKEGYAYEYTYYLPYKYQQQYKQAQIEAQQNKKGLWADNVCVTPTVSNLITPTTVIFNQRKYK